MINNHANMLGTVDCALRQLLGLEPVPPANFRSPPASWGRHTGSYVVQDVFGNRWTAKISQEGDRAWIEYPDWELAPSIRAAYPEGAALRQRFHDSFSHGYAGEQTLTFEPGGADAGYSGWMRNRYYVGQRVGELPERLDIEGWGCASLDLVAGLDSADLGVRTFGLAPPRIWKDAPIAQGDPDDPASSRIKIDLDLGGPLGYLNAWLFEESDDNVELYLMQDMDGDGETRWPDELVERLTSSAAQGMFVPAREEAGDYQLWVHGQRVTGAGSKFNLDLVAIADVGDLRAEGRPGPLRPGDAARLEICVDAGRAGRGWSRNPEAPMQGLQADSVGIVELDFGAPGAIARVPVYWTPGEAPEPTQSRICLPLIRRER